MANATGVMPANLTMDAERTAAKLVGTYGADAIIVATCWARVAGAAGDPERAAAWLRVVLAVRERLQPHTDDAPELRAVS